MKQRAVEKFELQYEKLHFYLSCGLIGHGDLECHFPAAQGKLPFDRKLRAPNDRRKKLQPFSQADATSSWNSDYRDHSGRKSNPGSASIHTNHADEGSGLKRGEEDVTSLNSKTHGGAWLLKSV